MFLEINDVRKTYGKSQGKTEALKGITLSINEGDFCILLGSSGCGKSTLLNCIGALDDFDQGTILVNGQNIHTFSKKEKEMYRRNTIGFIFQSYNLIQNLSVRENIEVCKNLTKSPLNIDELIQILGLTSFENSFPTMLSGGQQQRVAIARALVKNPKLLLCDEPTGALDSVSAKEIFQLLWDIHEKYHTTVLVITHNRAIQPIADKVFVMKDGVIVNEIVNEQKTPVSQIEGL